MQKNDMHNMRGTSVPTETARYPSTSMVADNPSQYARATHRFIQPHRDPIKQQICFLHIAVTACRCTKTSFHYQVFHSLRSWNGAFPQSHVKRHTAQPVVR